nr:hypothetical protein [Tanacetum cinerariifolium]
MLSPPPAQVYSPPKKDLSWTGLPEFIDDTVTDYSRPTPSIDTSKCNSSDLQSSNFSVSEHGESSDSIMSKPMIKFVKAADCPRVTKTNNIKHARKSTGNSQNKIDDKGYWDSGCSWYMTSNISYLSEYEPYDGGYVSFGQGGGKITGKQHMDLLGPTSVSSLNHKCILRNFITEIEDLKDLKVKIIRCDNGGEFKNKEMNEFCTKKGIRREFSNDHLGKFNDKGDEGYFVGYSMSSKAFKVFNNRTKKVEENLHVDFLENELIEKGAGPNWLFDIDTLTNSMNYVPVVVAGTSSTNISGTKDVASQAVKKDVSSLRYIALLNGFHEAHMESSNSDAQDDCNADVPESSWISNPTATSKVPSADQVEHVVSLTVETKIPTVSSHVPTVCLDISPESSSDPRIILKGDFSQQETPSLGNALTLSNRFEDTFGEEANLSNMETSILVSHTPTVRIHKDHPKSQIIVPVDTPVQTRHKSKEMEEQSFIATIHQKTNPDLLRFCLFSCFLSQEEPKKIFDALKDPSWVEAMQEELLQFKIQNVWILVDCPKEARLVAQGYTQEEGIDYEEVFAPVARIEAIRLFLAYASFMGFTVYQMDVKSAFLYGTIDEDVYVMQPPGFQDLEFPDRVYKEEKAMYGLHQTLFIRKHKEEFLLVQVYVDDIIFGSSNLQLCREFEELMHEKFQMSAMGELTFFLGLQVLQKKDGIFLSQDKYVGDILKKFGYSDVRSIMGSLMYLTASKLDIMFAVCAYARYQVTPKECHLHAVKTIFRYLKGHPNLGLWYPKESPFDLVVYSDSDYGGATQDRKSTNGGCQFLGRRLISWQCKKQTIMATSTIEAKYVAAASGCGQVLWIQNQMLDYGLAFCDYYNMIVILEKSEHNIDFHQIVDFIKASHIRIETTNEGTKILATIDGKPMAIFESSIRRNLKLNDEVNNPSFSGRTVPLFASILVTLDEGSGIPTEPHHTPSPQAQQSPHHRTSSSSHPTATSKQIPTKIPIEIPTLRQYSRRATRIAQSKALFTTANEPASLLRDDNQGEAFPTLTSLDARHDRENIIKTSALPHNQHQRQQTEMASKIKAQDLEISSLKARVKILEDKDRGSVEPSGDDAPIKGRKMDEEIAREDQRMNEQLARDDEIARLHAEEELKIMIEGLDKSNEIIEKHLQEYEQYEAKLTNGEKIELINELEQREFYMSVFKSHPRWKTRHFRGMTLEEIKEKFIPVWKQFEEFVLMASKEEGKRVKRKGLKLEQRSAKKMKTSEEVSEEDLKEMMQLVHVEEVYVEALQVKHLIIDWEIHSEGKKDYSKIIRLGGHTAVYQFL